jgi:HlyD family secretion protein
VQSLKLDRAVTIVADRRTNAVIVQAPQEEMERVTELIRTLDAETPDNARAAESATGTNASSRPIAIVPPKPGFVQRVFVAPGTTVKKGDPLVQLGDVETEGKLNNAIVQLDIVKAALMNQEAEANGVRREYDRLKALADHKALPGPKAVSADELEAKKTAVEVAEARIVKAQAELKLAEQQAQQAKMEVNALTIRAPKGGTVTRVRVELGEYVAGPSSRPLMMIGP